jgi:AcrR family transcriptional regulator
VARYRVGLETRRRILDATLEALAEEGLNDLTLKAITDRAGVGAGSFYNLFDSKEAAILEVVREAIEAVDPDPSGLGKERVTDLVDAFVSFFVDPRTALAARIYLQLALAGALTDDTVAARVKRAHRARIDRFAAAFRREHDDLTAAQAGALAERLLAALVGSCMTWLIDPSVQLRRHAAALVEAIAPSGPAATT